MILKRLYLQNFLAVGEDAIDIDFSRPNGVTVIKGSNKDVSDKSSNGSGKSTIIEGIIFGLTGSTLRKLTLPGVINNKSTDECKVEIWFDDVHIKRTLKRQGKSVKSSVELIVNGVAQTTASGPETNKLIDQQVGINFETLTNILIFGQHNIISFLDASEGDKREIIENLMNLREYNAYEENAKALYKDAKVKLKTLGDTHAVHTKHYDEQKRIQTEQEKALKDYRDSLTRDIEILKARMAAIPDIEALKVMWRQFNDFVDAKQKLNQRISDLNAEKNQSQSDYNIVVANKQAAACDKLPLVEKVNNAKGKLTILEDRKNEAWRKMILPIDAEIADVLKNSSSIASAYEKQLSDVRPDNKFKWELSDVEAQITKLTDRKTTIQNNGPKVDEQCPTCYGKVDKTNVDKVVCGIDKELQPLKERAEFLQGCVVNEERKVKEAQDRIKHDAEQFHVGFTTRINDLAEKRKTTEDGIKTSYFKAKEVLDANLAMHQGYMDAFDDDLNAKFDRLIKSKKDEVTKATAEIQKVQSAINSLPVISKPSVAPEEIGKLQAQLDADKKTKDEKEQLLIKNPYLEMIETLSLSINKIKGDIQSVAKDIAEIEAKMPYYEFWVGHMGKEGIKSYVVDQIVPTLNQQIDYWLQLIYQGSITVKFDKFFNVSMINNASKNEMIFGQGSGGERRRIDIAIMLAFRQVMKLSTGKDPNVLFFDEIAENLDEDGVYHLYDAILELSKTNHLYIITHNPTLLNLLQCANEIKVVKNNGFMKIAA